MGSLNSSQVLLVIVFVAAVTSLSGLTSKDILCWDEGVYYTEARYLVQTGGLSLRYLWHRLSPRRPFDWEQERANVTGMAPRMGRPLNALANAAALALLGDHPWVPALVAALAGLGCLCVVFGIMRHLCDDTAGLVSAGLLALSPYFLPYRRLGLPEAGGALLACLTVWLLLTRAEDRGRRSRAASCWLGVLCGLSFGVNTRTLLLLPAVVFWRTWHKRRQSEHTGGEGSSAWRTSAWLHSGLVVAGFGATLALYQLPYLLLSIAGLPVEAESYLQQLHRLAAVQQELGGVGPASAYKAMGYFLAYYEGPLLALVVAGLVSGLRRQGSTHCLTDRRFPALPSLLALPLLQTAVLIPYARYQSWLLPILAMIGAVGVRALLAQWLPGGEAAQAARASAEAAPRSRRVARVYMVLSFLLFVWLIWHACCRYASILPCHSRQAEALRWARAHGAITVIDSNMSAALSHSPLYRLQALEQLPPEREETMQALRRRQAQGRVMVILEAQQFMRAAVVMSPAQYEGSAAAAIRRGVRPLWRADDHLRGLFPWLCFEHNRLLADTLQTLAVYREAASTIAVYDGEAVAEALQREGLPPTRRPEQ